ncbi:MAG: hypothetical protein AB7K86_19640 [Rhodospirillales bacterium]
MKLHATDTAGAVARRAAWPSVALFAPPRPKAEAAFHAVLAVVAPLCAIVLWLAAQPFAFPLDDAYLTLHNAKVLLAGADENYAGVPALAGATSLVHLAAVAALAGLMTPVAAGFAVNAAAVALYVHGLAHLAFRTGGTPALAAILVVLGCATGYAPYHLFNGLETGLAMAAVTWALALAAAARPSRVLALLCGAMPFVRPELAALSLLLLARQAWRRGAEAGATAAALPAIAADAALCMSAAAPWLAWSWAATGALLPSTAAAKEAFFGQAALPAWLRLKAIAAALGRCNVGPAFLAVLLLRGAPLAWCAWTFLAAVLFAYFASFPGGMGHNWYRYTYPLLPLGLYALVVVLATRRDMLPRVLLAAAVGWCAITVPITLKKDRLGRDWTRTELEEVARFAEATLPANARVLVHDAGYIAFATRLRLVDVVGLKTPAVIADHWRWTAPSAGERRHEAVHRIAMRYGVTHAVVLQDVEAFWWTIADDLRRHGWTLQTLRTRPDGHGFVIFRLTPPNA